MKIFKYGLFVSFLALTACNREQATLKYSFFTAGHAYGNPMHPQRGFYPPFKKQIEFLNAYPKMSMGFLTGDLVFEPTDSAWQAIENDMKLFDVPTHIAKGNHDVSEYFDRHFPSYEAWTFQDDLFVVLSSDNWQIEGEQLEFLLQILEKHKNSVSHVFVFCHELIWWSPNGPFSEVEVNYSPYFPGKTNYWQDIHPRLSSLKQDVYIFSGDVGATVKVSPFARFKVDNVTFVASGMGGGVQDNVAVVEVGKDGDVEVKIMGLNAQKPFELKCVEQIKSPPFP